MMRQQELFNEQRALQQPQQENKKLTAAEKKKAKEELKKAKKKSKTKSKDGKRNSLILAQSDNSVTLPLFLVKCISFIEENGLDSEGLYR